jgi:hypothetical protein
MITIDKNKIPFKYLIRFTIINPTIEDLLYEIVSLIIDKNENSINNWEISNKTKTRINEKIEDDIQLLIDKGYLEKDKYTKYMIINHPWK